MKVDITRKIQNLFITVGSMELSRPSVHIKLNMNRRTHSSSGHSLLAQKICTTVAPVIASAHTACMTKHSARLHHHLGFFNGYH